MNKTVLLQSFDTLLHQLKQLIDDGYKAKITQQKLEMTALQAQINPHFFYNSLSLINNKAIMIGNSEIAEMTQLLSRFYRLSLNQGKNLITVKDELALTITYAKIQKRMHDNGFDLVIQTDDDIGNYKMINLLLQPFVENAIFHGIDHITDGRRGRLCIRAEKIADYLVFEIKDNGVGMTPQQISDIFRINGTNYGIKNVNKRISLYYHNYHAKDTAITIASTRNEGTTVRMTLPAEK